MSIRIIVNGAHGNMGSLAYQTLQNQQDFNVVAALGHGDNLAQAIQRTDAQVVVDLTRADCVYENSLTIIQNGARPVIGTTGLMMEQIHALQALCATKQLGGIIAPNFSISAVLMMRFAEIAARYLSEVEIIETHHQGKLDAPSGTALKTAEMIAHARRNPKKVLELKELLPGVRGGAHQAVPIHSLRLPGVLARQQVLFGSTGETLSITHDTSDRACFMQGLVLACQEVQKIDSLYYGLEHFLT